jgi:hypothetical protein
LAPEFLASANTALAAWDIQWQNFRNAQLAALLDRAQREADQLNPTNGVQTVRSAMPRVESVLREAKPFDTQPPALDPALAQRLGQIRNQVEVSSNMLAKWDQVRTALSTADSLEAYLQGLDQWARSPLATPAQSEAAAKVTRLHLTYATLLGQLLLPDDRSRWNSLTNAGAWSANLMPEQPTAQEKDVYFKLRDDKNLRDVNAYQLITNSRAGNPHRSHPVFVQGVMALNKAGDQTGVVYDPSEYTNTLHFSRISYSDWDYKQVKFLWHTPESDSYANLGLGELIDANTGNYQKPILQYFDQLNQDARSSSICRAFVTLRLLAVADLRPNEWGFQWCPAVAAHLQALKQLGADDIKSGDWMVPAQSDKYEAALQRYFEQVRSVPLEKQAAFLRQLVRQTCEKGFVFAGFIDADGQPVLRQLDPPANELWGWDNRPAAALLLRKSAGAQANSPLAPPLPFSPLFAFVGDRREALQRASTAAAYRPEPAAPVLPPFYSGPYE